MIKTINEKKVMNSYFYMIRANKTGTHFMIFILIFVENCLQFDAIHDFSVWKIYYRLMRGNHSIISKICILVIINTKKTFLQKKDIKIYVKSQAQAVMAKKIQLILEIKTKC